MHLVWQSDFLADGAGYARTNCEISRENKPFSSSTSVQWRIVFVRMNVNQVELNQNCRYFYGAAGIESCDPGATLLGEPDQIVHLGKSEIPYSLFLEYLFSLGESTFGCETKYIHLFNVTTNCLFNR